MDVTVTEFSSPFSFFCRSNDGSLDLEMLKENSDNFQNLKNIVSNVNHGQYVAVFWKNKWLRGIVSMETEYEIWLVDYGFHLRANDKMVVMDLAPEYRKYPTKVFEASIHGVVPLDITLVAEDDFQIANIASCTWNKGSIERAQNLIEAASKTYFVPMAIISTKQNDIVIGDLQLQIPERGLCNLANELEMWPRFLERNGESYIQNLTLHYTTRRKHRACPMKPDISRSDLPKLSLEASFSEYSAICYEFAQSQPTNDYHSDSEDGSTIVNFNQEQKNNDAFRLTAQEIEKYANLQVKIFDRSYNALHLLLNKIKDLNLCERYKDHDLKSVGRGYVRRGYVRNNKTDL